MFANRLKLFKAPFHHIMQDSPLKTTGNLRRYYGSNNKNEDSKEAVLDGILIGLLASGCLFGTGATLLSKEKNTTALPSESVDCSSEESQSDKGHTPTGR